MNQHPTDEANEELVKQLTDQAKQLLLKKLFQQSRFANLDGLNEYDENYRFFTDRGDLIPAEMKLALARLQQNDSPEQPVDIAQIEPEATDDTEDV